MRTLALLFAASFVLTALGLTFWGLGTYNELVHKDETVNGAWAQVQNVYQRRADLIPNLVATVQGYATHERTTLAAVAQARASATAIQLTPEALRDPTALARFQAAQQHLSGALARLLVTLEKYPTLKADRGFLQLQAQLEETDNRIAVERARFNDAVRDYNTRVALFPGNLVSGRLGYTERPYFQADAGAQKAPRVEFR